MLFFVQIPEAEHEFVEYVPDLAILPTNSEVSNMQAMSNLLSKPLLSNTSYM
jgi:hypothetical protein